MKTSFIYLYIFRFSKQKTDSLLIKSLECYPRHPVLASLLFSVLIYVLLFTFFFRDRFKVSKIILELWKKTKNIILPMKNFRHIISAWWTKVILFAKISTQVVSTVFQIILIWMAKNFDHVLLPYLKPDQSTLKRFMIRKTRLRNRTIF